MMHEIQKKKFEKKRGKMECQVQEFLVCWVNQLASRNLIILKPLLKDLRNGKTTFFVSFYELFRNTNSSYADYFKVGPSILFLSHTGWLRRDTLQFWTNQCLCTSLIIRSILQMVIQCTLKLANWAEIKIYVRRNLRFRSVSDISRVKKKKKTKQNKTKKLSVRDRFTWLRGLSTRTFVARRPRSQETRAQKFTYGFREVMKVRPAGWNDLQPSDVICGSSNGSLALGLTPKLVHGTRREKE